MDALRGRRALKEAAALRKMIIRSLRAQKFRFHNGAILPPRNLSKDRIRRLHETAVEHRLERAKPYLARKEELLLDHFASGEELNPERMFPRLVEVLPGSQEELLFRYATLHWSIPVSSGYGRRLRFLVVDGSNEKLVGVIGLGDPVYSLGPRDRWVGWSASARKKRLKNVMDAFVLGAVPPYSFLLCGKLVAMLAASDTVRDAFKRKYGGTRSRISGSRHDGRLAMIGTASALGRSSIYNRLKLGSRVLYRSVGFTRGSGEFHFSNGLYSSISAFAEKYSSPTAKRERWGTGFRSRREVIRKCLQALQLSQDWMYHGIRREIFVVPLAGNTREFLCGHHSRLLWQHLSEADVYQHFRTRWMVPRASWDQRFRSWSRRDMAIWSGGEQGRA